MNLKDMSPLDWDALRSSVSAQTGSHPTDPPTYPRARPYNHQYARQRIIDAIHRVAIRHKIGYDAMLEQFLLCMTTEELDTNWKEIRSVLTEHKKESGNE